jgi:hypothetical protein
MIQALSPSLLFPPADPGSVTVEGEEHMAVLISSIRPVIGALALTIAAGVGGARAASSETAFTITVESVTTPLTLKLPDGSGAPAPLSPGAAYAGREISPFFTVGKAASKGLQRQAEAGMPDGLVAEVKGAVMFGRNEPVTITAKPGGRFTFAVMFGQSNDLFYAPKAGSLALFDKSGKPIVGNRTAEIALFDAGTELNQVPGVGPDQGPRQKTWRQGALEHGTMTPVRDTWAYPALPEVIRVTVSVAGASS